MQQITVPIPATIDWLMIAPVVAVICTGIIALIIEMLGKRRDDNNLIASVSIGGLLVAAGMIVYQLFCVEMETFGQMVLRDRVGLLLQLVILGACGLSMLFSEGYLREKKIPFAEFYPLALWSASGAMIMVSTKSLLMLFVGLEVLSIALYVMAGMSRKESKSEESAIKYFLLGAFASGFFLYGISFIYGATGSLHLDQVVLSWQNGTGQVRGLLGFGLILMLIGVSFKAAFVPFHQWAPDVYQGAPSNVTAFMAAVSKVAAVGVLYRVLDGTMIMREFWMPSLFWIAVLSMTIGNLIALTQSDVKRTLAYSSIANAGYVLVALLAHFNSPEKISLASTVVFLVGYAITTVGAFAIVSLTASGGEEGTRFSDLHGLWKRSPFAAGLLILFVCSLIGIPPTAGFVGKLMIFQDALIADLAPLAIVLAVNSAVSIAYYLAIAKAVFVNDEGAVPTRSAKMSAGNLATGLLCAVGVFAVMTWVTPIKVYLNGGEQPEAMKRSSQAISAKVDRP